MLSHFNSVRVRLFQCQSCYVILGYLCHVISG